MAKIISLKQQRPLTDQERSCTFSSILLGHILDIIFHVVLLMDANGIFNLTCWLSTMDLCTQSQLMVVFANIVLCLQGVALL